MVYRLRRPGAGAIARGNGSPRALLIAGLDLEDVLLQLGVLRRTDRGCDGEARAERILGLVVDGPRAQGLPSCDTARGPLSGAAYLLDRHRAVLVQ
ncbi:hypothetical protein [Streptomyces sp. NPDC001435]|uniref:hypothetical protein n=1 Tax=Streptomyces sp. NPDC001435 TaxID=3364576 RepID=UPI003688FC31